jgi:dihydrofolate synthase/folylpolyglutamate synthase
VPDDIRTSAGDAIYESLLSRLGEAAPQPRLEPTRRAAELAGDPQKAYPIIHVTGTNGKTSTSRMVGSILHSHGLKVGVFTSPHLLRFNERILIEGRPIDDGDLLGAWDEIQSALMAVDSDLHRAAQPRLTFFEVMTVLAFTCFARERVDVAVIEVGIGGQWDSTNIADGRVAVLTPISLDHMQLLGSTVSEIARTKSGIIKAQADVVTSRQHPDALADIEQMVELTSSTIAIEGNSFEATPRSVNASGQVFDYRGLNRELHAGLPLALFGAHQVQNAGVAIAAVECLLADLALPLNNASLAAGLRWVTSPGRLEVIGASPLIILDAAHNPNGAESLVAALHDQFTLTEVAFVIGILDDKDARGIVSRLAPIATRFYSTQSHSIRAIDHERLRGLIASVAPEVEIDPRPDLPTALEAASQWASEMPGRAVVVTGSITLIAEVYALVP